MLENNKKGFFKFKCSIFALFFLSTFQIAVINKRIKRGYQNTQKFQG
eukprot:UN02283